MEKTFKKAIALLKEAGIDYKDITNPFWSEEQDGVVLPFFGKVIPRLESEKNKRTWREAMDDAAAAGLTLPTMEELQYMYHHLDQINGLLLAHNGNCLPQNTYFWTSTECSRASAWYVGFGSGSTTNYFKYSTYYCRPLAAFNGFDKGK